MSKNTCCTYFRVTGDFDPDLVTERLGLQPDKFWKIGDKRRNGTEYDLHRGRLVTAKNMMC